MNAAAGARRTSAALSRFQAASRAADVEVTVGTVRDTQLREFAATPQVLARVVRGRLADNRAPEEIAIGEALVRRLRVDVGSTLTFVTYSPAQSRFAATGQDPGDPRGPQVSMRVVGVVRRPLDLAARGAVGGVIVMTPAFHEKYSGLIGSAAGEILRVRTRNGATDVPAVVASARRIFGTNDTFGVQSLGIESEGARDAIKVLAVALWIFAAIAGAVLGAAGATAALVFAASSAHLVDTPRLYGWSFDAVVLPTAVGDPAPRTPTVCGDVDAPAVRDPAFSAVGSVCTANIEIDGRPSPGVTLEELPRDGETGLAQVKSGGALGTVIPVEIERIRRVRRLPAVLGGFLALLALIAIAHTLVVAGRLRRHDLAVLRALGFTRRQVRATIAWQSTTIGIAGLVVGVPIGLIIGNLVWRNVAEGLGVAALTIRTPLALSGLAIAAIGLVNVIGALAARRVVRERPGAVLRAE